MFVSTSALYLPFLSSMWALEILRGRRVSQHRPLHASPPCHTLEDFEKKKKSKFIVAVSKFFEGFFLYVNLNTLVKKRGAHNS